MAGWRFPSALALTNAERSLIDLARVTIDAATDAGPNEDGVHTIGAAVGARELTHIVAVGNHGRGVKSPCGRDRQILADYYPGIRVILPSPAGLQSVLAGELLPLSFDYLAEQADPRKPEVPK